MMMLKPLPNRDVHISILMSRSLVERIDDFHSEQRLPSRVEAIRQLIEARLEAIGRHNNRRS
jgi:metal-responsive CopG/Arc/MetJ family transcriptional regulator